MAQDGSSSTQAPEMVPYTSAAAGHQGISTSADGSLLIKPCIQAEIDFYESAKLHPAFQAHMPVYMGHLSVGDEQIQAQASKLQTQQMGSVIESPTPAPVAPARTLTFAHRRTESGHIISEPRIARSATKEWTPSGGAKLSSNLSIVLSNATAGFCRPNVIDLKLGARLWDDDAPLAKRKKLDDVAKSSTSGSLGFRVAGMKVYVGEDTTNEIEREVNTEIGDGFKTYNKFYGRDSITDANIANAFEAFLYSLNLPRTSGLPDLDAATTSRKQLLKRKLIIERLMTEVSSMEYVLQNQESRMYSASILMVYEGDPDALESVVQYKVRDEKVVDAEAIESEDEENEDEVEDDGDEDQPPKQKVHEAVIIDFAHAHWTPGLGPDENALKGVRSIRKILEVMLDQAQEKLNT